MKGLYELQQSADQLGIDYSQATKEEIMSRIAIELATQWDVKLLPQCSVMLARNVKDLPEAEVAKMLIDGNWIAEEKLDGMRAKLHILKTGNRIDTRHRSDVNYAYCERTKQLPHLRYICSDYHGTVLDGELRMPVEKIVFGKTKTDSYLTSTTATVNSLPDRACLMQASLGNCLYFAFDILFCCGEDIRSWSYDRRYKLLQQLTINYPMIRLPLRATKDLEKFYNRILTADGEGIMLKHLSRSYIDAGPGGCRRPKCMYKMKKHKEVDCFITGFTPGEGEFSGLVGALLVSILVDGKAQEIGAIQPGKLCLRSSMSTTDGSLQDEYYSKVVEVNYLCKTKNNRMRHATLQLFRPDKTMYDCTEF